MLTIHKTQEEVLSVTIKGVEHKFVVGKRLADGTKPLKFEYFTKDDVMYIGGFDTIGTFFGWAEINPAPKTVADVALLGYDVFEAALAAARVKIQAQIKAKTDGKIRIASAAFELTQQFIAGKIDEKTLREKVAKLSGNVVQL